MRTRVSKWPHRPLDRRGSALLLQVCASLLSVYRLDLLCPLPVKAVSVIKVDGILLLLHSLLPLPQIDRQDPAPVEGEGGGRGSSLFPRCVLQHVLLLCIKCPMRVMQV